LPLKNCLPLQVEDIINHSLASRFEADMSEEEAHSVLQDAVDKLLNFMAKHMSGTAPAPGMELFGPADSGRGAQLLWCLS
jgi:hypothetical protein